VSELVEVILETLLGARYVFPDMPRTALTPNFINAAATASGKVVLVNVSGAMLTLPSRIVGTIFFDGEVKWSNAEVRELPETD
jgi:hypothetical protein